MPIVSLPTRIVPGLIQAVENATDLTQAHYDEVCTNKQLLRMDVDWARFRALESQGSLVTLLAFEGPDLVGYSVNFVVPAHLHYRGFAYLVNDLLFVRQQSRRGGLGKKLIDETRKAARTLGLKAVQWHAKEGSPLEALLRAMGHKVQDVILMKEV